MESKIAKIILKRNKVVELTFPDFKTHSTKQQLLKQHSAGIRIHMIINGMELRVQKHTTIFMIS
jgi:hypothetical protein